MSWNLFELWAKGKVTTQNDTLNLYCNKKEIKVAAVEGEGKLIFKNKPSSNSGNIIQLVKNKY